MQKENLPFRNILNKIENDPSYNRQLNDDEFITLAEEGRGKTDIQESNLTVNFGKVYDLKIAFPSFKAIDTNYVLVAGYDGSLNVYWKALIIKYNEDPSNKPPSLNEDVGSKFLPTLFQKEAENEKEVKPSNQPIAKTQQSQQFISACKKIESSRNFRDMSDVELFQLAEESKTTSLYAFQVLEDVSFKKLGKVYQLKSVSFNKTSIDKSLVIVVMEDGKSGIYLKREVEAFCKRNTTSPIRLPVSIDRILQLKEDQKKEINSEKPKSIFNRNNLNIFGATTGTPVGDTNKGTSNPLLNSADLLEGDNARSTLSDLSEEELYDDASEEAKERKTPRKHS